MIDLHCHILPGIDDGAPDIEAALELARAFLAEGTTTVVATPHVNTRYANDPGTIAAALEELRAALGEEGVKLTVEAGAELALPQLADLDDPAPYGLAGGRCLLVESPYVPSVSFLEDLLLDLQAGGFLPLLAHPERSPLFERDPARLRGLVEQGVCCSLTAGSLAGRFGRSVQGFALQLVREGLCHDVSSDAHDLRRRPPGLGVAFDEELAPWRDWLTREAPEALLAGQAPPPAPPLPERSRGLLRRFLRR